MKIQTAPMTPQEAGKFLRGIAETTAQHSQNWDNFEAIAADLIKSAYEGGAATSAPAQEAREPIAWVVQWRTPHTPKTVSAYVKEDDARRAGVNVARYADASDVTVTPAYALPSAHRGGE